jgi:hypothetical protein
MGSEKGGSVVEPKLGCELTAGEKFVVHVKLETGGALSEVCLIWRCAYRTTFTEVGHEHCISSRRQPSWCQLVHCLRNLEESFTPSSFAFSRVLLAPSAGIDILIP